MVLSNMHHGGKKYKRPLLKTLIRRLSEPRRFMQVLAGPRQTGKTTLALQAMNEVHVPCVYASADEPALKSTSWIEQQWETVRAKGPVDGAVSRGLLILDEIHKIPGWSETVKRLWDEDCASGRDIHVMLLGSSPLLVRQGLTESLAGRFETLHVSHWSFQEMKEAFGWDVERFVYFGAYPGAAGLVEDRQRWARYILDSLIETTLSRDILLTTRVDKPALLRQLFELGCAYSAQVLSYQKMLGQLHDAGNTTTLAHYLNLLEGAGLIAGLQKYAVAKLRQRASSPKLLVLNTALMSAMSPLSFEETRHESNVWGRLVESAVGASLANRTSEKGFELFYWTGRNREVDFVLRRGKKLTVIEVKSGQKKTTLPGIEAFSKQFKVTRRLLVGTRGISLHDFLMQEHESWL